MSWRRAGRRMRDGSILCNVEDGRLGCRWADGGGDCDEDKVMVVMGRVTAKVVAGSIDTVGYLKLAGSRELRRAASEATVPERDSEPAQEKRR